MTTNGLRALPVTSILVLATVGAGCAPARMAVPKDVSEASEEIVVADRSAMSGALADESFKMGPYQVVVDRKWTSKDSLTILGAASAKTKAGYAFGLKAPQGAYKGECAIQVDDRSTGILGITVGQQKYNVLCRCGGPADASLTIAADTTSHYRGTVKARGANYAISGIYTDEKGGSQGKPTGYEVRAERPSGAVEVVGKGRVWLSRALEPGARADLACLFAGLLLYQEPKED